MADVSLASLNSLEKLLLTQSVHEKHDHDWKEVADIMTNHPLLQPFGRAKTFWDVGRCRGTLSALMSLHSIAWPEEGNGAAKMREKRIWSTQAFKKAVIDLANILYLSRMKELKALIKAEEDSFRLLVSEIDQIRTGKWDTRISDQIQLAEKQRKQRQAALPKPGPIVATSSTPISAAKSAPEVIDVDAPKAEQEDPKTTEASQTVHPDAASPLKNEVIAAAKDVPQTQGPEARDVEPVASSSKSAEPAVSSPAATVVEPPPAKEPETPADVPERPPPPSSPRLRKRTRGSSLSSVSEVRDSRQSPPKELEDHEEPLAKRRAARSGRLPQIDEETALATPKTRSRPSSRTRAASHNDEVSTPPALHKRTSRQGDLVESIPEHVAVASPDTEAKVEDEDMSSPASKAADKERSIKKLQQLIMMVHRDISNHRFAANFATPVRRGDAPDYYLIVKQPLDLKTIRGRIRDGLIVTVDHYERDIMLMFTNALMYNAPDSDIAQWASEMRDHSLELLRQFRANQSVAVDNEGVEAAKIEEDTGASGLPPSATATPPSPISTRRRSIVRVSDEDHETEVEASRLRRRRA